jgi:hypothetical protein
MIVVHALDGTEVDVNEAAVTLVAGPYPHDLGPHTYVARRRPRGPGDGRGSRSTGRPPGRRSTIGEAHPPGLDAGLGQGTGRYRDPPAARDGVAR